MIIIYRTVVSMMDGVCVVTHPLSSAGENATRSLLDVLSAITQVSLITADLPGDSSIHRDHRVVEISRAGSGVDRSVFVAAPRFLVNQLRMCHAILGRDEDVILFFGATSYLLPVLLSRAIGKTVVVQPRGDVPLTLRLQWEERYPAYLARVLAYPVYLLERANYWLADAIITYTPSMADQLGITHSPKLHPNGARYVNTDVFYPRVEFGERDDVIGFVGRLDTEKNVEVLAEVARRTPYNFLFVGDGAKREWLEDTLSEEIRDGRVEVSGWVDHDDVPRYMSRMKLLLLPSHPTEGLPTTVLEAMACGTPVAANPVSGVPDIVIQDETGFLLTSLDVDYVVEEIEDVFRSGDFEEVSRNCRELIESRYSFDAAVERYREILGSIER